MDESVQLLNTESQQLSQVSTSDDPLRVQSPYEEKSSIGNQEKEAPTVFDEAVEQPTQRQRRSDMSNEDNDDVNDVMDENEARGGSSIPALGMNGSDLNGIKGPENSQVLDEEKTIEVVSEDGADDDFRDEDDQLQAPTGSGRGGDESRGGYWGSKNLSRSNGQTATIVASGGIVGSDGNPILSRPGSRPVSPGIMDNLSDISSQLPITAPLTRSKSRSEFGGGSVIGSNRPPYSSNFWKARRVLFYRNGDPFFPGIEYRFKPGRDVMTIEALLDKISPRMDLPRGARFIFSMDGDRKFSLDELEDGSSYVVSSFNKFKVSSVTQFPLAKGLTWWILDSVT